MAETEKILERTYIVPLRKEWLKVPHYKRANKAVKALKQFIAKHMKIADRDTRNVRLDKWVNQEIWFRGIKKPMAKIKVIAKKEGEFVDIRLAEEPEYVKFKRLKEEKLEKAIEKAAEKKEEKAEEKKEVGEEKKAEEKKEETPEKAKEAAEKKSAVVEAGQEIAKQQAKNIKHTAIEKQATKDIITATRRATKGH